MLPYGRQSIDEADVQAVADVLRGDWLTTGPAVDRFERELGELAGVGSPAASVTSGTAALHAAYAGLGLGPGDEVVTTPMTFVATASGASLTGAKVIFADICEDTGNLDPAAAEAAVSARTRVVAGVDYAGHPIDAPALQKVARAAGAVLLEDAAHSIGGSLDGVPVGSLADITTFSFFPTKNMTTAEGGAVVARDPSHIEAIRQFKMIGRSTAPARSPEDEGAWWYEMDRLGLNYRLPDVLAALGSSQLRRLSAFKERRQAITDRYNEAFVQVDTLRVPGHRAGADAVWHLYPLRIRDGRRRALFDHLRARGIGVQVNYIPVYWHPVYAELGYRRGACPVAERFYEEEISLPMYPDLTDADVDQVIELVVDFAR